MACVGCILEGPLLSITLIALTNTTIAGGRNGHSLMSDFLLNKDSKDKKPYCYNSVILTYETSPINLIKTVTTILSLKI
jgi:hypothetical protein